ncbi:MAG: hypothetical protein A2138_14220 [Deltaproteobacteria bacterium RBG_16_71_12]|nr:MAG: hypothetical protein A2138_14220 [Deltaproteobacteria bacterium RBG_16_71_12]
MAMMSPLPSSSGTAAKRARASSNAPYVYQRESVPTETPPSGGSTVPASTGAPPSKVAPASSTPPSSGPASTTCSTKPVPRTNTVAVGQRELPTSGWLTTKRLARSASASGANTTRKVSSSPGPMPVPSGISAS